MEEDRTRENRAATQEGIAFSAREKWQETPLNFNYILASQGKASEF
jgi:hypothetical protein